MSRVESAVIGSGSRQFGRWMVGELRQREQVAAVDGDRERFEFGAFVPTGKGVRVPVEEFERSPGRVIEGVTRASQLDEPVVFARKWAGFVEVMAGKHGPVPADLSGYLLG